MTSWLSEKVRRLRLWLLVRLGLWRGSWRRGRVTVERGSVYFNPLAPRTWRYGLYCPPGLSEDQGAPLIIVLHGCKQRALSFAQAGGWIRLADRAGVRLLCPDQRRLANLWRCWNWFHPLAQRGHGELLAVMRMIDDVATRVQIREEAIAAVGISAGGAMAALLAFHHPGRVRAAVAVAAPPLLGEFGAVNARDVLRRGLQGQPTRALGSLRHVCAPLAVMHGAADETVHPRCAEQLVAQALDSCRRGALHPVADVAQVKDSTTMVDYRIGDALHVRSISIEGLAHVWSGGPGGHPYCVVGGPPLTALCEQFLRDIGVLGGSSAQSSTRPSQDGSQG
jgi:poly(hydroxyalkanoate) depolymerase family esterase